MLNKSKESSKDSNEIMTLAIEEWKLLQSIIARLDDRIYKIRGWLFALLGVFVASTLAGNFPLEWWQFGIIGTALVILFLFMELSHHVPKAKATDRNKFVEQVMRGEKSYDGPKIGKTMASRPKHGRGWQVFYEMKRHTIWIPYPIVLLLVWLLSVLVH